MNTFRFFSFIFSFLFLLFFTIGASTISTQNYNSAQARTAINQSIAYINGINESGFLFLNPNLTQAYTYLNRSEESYNSSPAAAIGYAHQAELSANAALGKIEYYRPYALLGIVIFSMISGMILYLLMFNKNKSKYNK